MSNTRNPKRNNDCRKAGHQPQRLPSFDAAIHMRAINH